MPFTLSLFSIHLSISWVQMQPNCCHYLMKNRFCAARLTKIAQIWGEIKSMWWRMSNKVDWQCEYFHDRQTKTKYHWCLFTWASKSNLHLKIHFLFSLCNSQPSNIQPPMLSLSTCCTKLWISIFDLPFAHCKIVYSTKAINNFEAPVYFN